MNDIAIGKIDCQMTKTDVLGTILQAGKRLHALESTKLTETITETVQEIRVPFVKDNNILHPWLEQLCLKISRTYPHPVARTQSDVIQVLGRTNWIAIVLDDFTQSQEPYVLYPRAQINLSERIENYEQAKKLGDLPASLDMRFCPRCSNEVFFTSAQTCLHCGTTTYKNVFAFIMIKLDNAKRHIEIARDYLEKKEKDESVG